MMMLTVERLHTLTGQNYLTSLSEIVRQWNKLVNNLTTPLTEEEINELNTLATVSNVPFNINSNGLLN